VRIKQFYFLLFLIISSFYLLSCSDTITHGPDPSSTFSGIVVDSITGLPVDSAQIIYGDTLSSTLYTYTNTDGEYIISIGKVGIVDVYCRKESYLTEMKPLDIPNTNSIISDFDFKLIK